MCCRLLSGWMLRRLKLLSDHFPPSSAPCAGEEVRAFHATFLEYLLGVEHNQSTHPICFGGPQHALLASSCMSILNARLDHDLMQKLSTDPEYFSTLSLGALQYSLWMWAHHLTTSPRSTDLKQHFEKFMAESWGSYMGCMRSIHDAKTSSLWFLLSDVLQWYQVGFNQQRLWIQLSTCLTRSGIILTLM
jgi:hypothetical protein